GDHLAPAREEGLRRRLNPEFPDACRTSREVDLAHLWNPMRGVRRPLMLRKCFQELDPILESHLVTADQERGEHDLMHRHGDERRTQALLTPASNEEPTARDEDEIVGELGLRWRGQAKAEVCAPLGPDRNGSA